MSLYLVLMRYDDWLNHHGIQHKSSNQHVKQEYNKYIHSIPTRKDLTAHDDEYNKNLE